MSRGVLVIACCLAACGSKPAQAPQAGPASQAAAGAVAKPDPAPPELRLPTTAKPLANAVELTLDPETEVFSGTITIEIETSAALDVLWLNALELEVDKATIDGAPAAPVIAKHFLGLVPSKAIAAGKHTVRIEYRGKSTKNDGDGIYTAQEAGAWYAFTQFEATDARRAFPCFDEPGFKVPWQFTIRAPKDLVALSNTPAESERIEGAHKVTRFAPTPPLPSYLLAFAVGPFDFVDAGKSRQGVPIRIVVPKGRGADAAYPAEVTKEILALLEDYFGTPYPFQKLDLVAVSIFNAGAMENPGLITYRQPILLTKQEDMTLAKQQAYAAITAHEIAHQWFGNLVTLAWWDDVWLNEAFASWAEAKIVDQWKPAWDGAVSMVASKSRVMGQDSLDAARAIRQPITAHGDIESGFDGITYQKGEAVLTMLERWIGPETFQTGVRAYMKKHAWGNATYEGFVDAMTEVAGKNVRPMFDSFVLQSGVPKVAFELSCTAAPKLSLAQSRYAPTGSKIDPKRTWQIPVCVKWGAGTQTGRDCMLLGTATAELALSAKTCPDWILTNEGGVGYYRSEPRGKLLATLLARADKVLTLPERVGLVDDVSALVSSGDVKYGVALALVETLAKDKSRHIVDASVDVVAGIDELVRDDLRPNYERLIKKLYRARAVELGFASKKGESDDTKQLRPTLLALVAGTGRDAALIREATTLATKWLADHQALEPEVTAAVLSIAARYGDQALFDRVHAAAKQASDRAERAKLLGMLSSFADPKIVAQAMAIAVSDEFEVREGMGLLQGAFAKRATRASAYQFVKTNFDKIRDKLPEPYRPYLAFTVAALCDDARKAEVEAFWVPRMQAIEGGELVLKQALEGMSLCSAARKAQTPEVAAFLRKY